MSSWLKGTCLLILLGLSLSGCGENRSQTFAVPTPTDNTPPNQNIDPTPGGPDNRIPWELQTRGFNIFNWAQIGLQEIFAPEPIIGGIYGDVKVVLSVHNTTSLADASSTLLLYFEDLNAGQWAEWDSYEGNSGFSNDNIGQTVFNGIYSDDTVTMKVTGTVTSTSTLWGSVHYRVRQTGDTQCLPVFCPSTEAYCNQFAIYRDRKVNCTNYMNFGNSQVRQLGTFGDATGSDPSKVVPLSNVLNH